VDSVVKWAESATTRAEELPITQPDSSAGLLAQILDTENPNDARDRVDPRAPCSFITALGVEKFVLHRLGSISPDLCLSFFNDLIHTGIINSEPIGAAMEVTTLQETAASYDSSPDAAPSLGSPPTSQFWACPFQKANPDRFSRCPRGIREVRRIKYVHHVLPQASRPTAALHACREHIYRKHKLNYCRRCHAVFDTPTDLESHHRGRRDECTQIDDPAPVLTCGIGDEAERLLRKRPQSGLDEKARWYKIFPGSEQPLSPCRSLAQLTLWGLF